MLGIERMMRLCVLGIRRVHVSNHAEFALRFHIIQRCVEMLGSAFAARFAPGM